INAILLKINTFVSSVNIFFNDTGKEIYIDKNTGDLRVYVHINKKNKVSIEISELSSGEQQLIVIFSYLIFYTSKDQLFLIDEPELSLHVKWQENFLKIIDRANAKKNQIVISTHSP